jgi:subtilisin-like proprotein convertase family protein/endonuclease/exonuclease/phosphatase family metal-dependent hydrolase
MARRLQLIALALGIVAFASPVRATPVRVATYNVLQGIGATGTTSYINAKAVIARVNPDVISLQELQGTDITGGYFAVLAAQLGYPYTAIADASPLDGTLRVGFFSRWPILSATSIRSTAPANELARLPFAVRVDVPGTSDDAVFIGLHLKCCYASSADSFRRSIEFLRVREYAQSQGLGSNANVFILGDLNVVGVDNEVFNSLPAGLPGSYVVGADVTYPVTYRKDPALHFPAPTWDYRTILAKQVDGATWTEGGSAKLDFILTTAGVTNRGVQAEVYNSAKDTPGNPGLPKSGSAPASNASSLASDHLLVFADVDIGGVASPALAASFAPSAVAEDAGTDAAALTVTLPAAASNTVTVTINNPAPDEIVASTNILVFTPGQTNRTLAFTPQTDGSVDGDQLVAVTLSATGYLSAGASINVLDVDEAAGPAGAGDIAVVGYNCDNPDEIAFVALRAFTAGESVTFTDNGWSNGVFRNGEGTLTYTFASNVTAGTIVSTTNLGTIQLSTSNDQILVYQGTSSAPAFVFALNAGSTNWQAFATGANDSGLPPGVTNASVAVNGQNAIFRTNVLASGTKAQWLAAITNPANWSVNDVTRFAMPAGPIVVTGGGAPSNAAPSIAFIADPAITEDAALGPLTVTLADVDTPANLLVLTASSGNTNLLPNSAIELTGTGSNRTLRAWPAPDANGTGVVTLTVSDGITSSWRAFTLHVTPVNDPPTVAALPDQAIQFGSGPGLITVAVVDKDTPATGLVFSASCSNSALFAPGGLAFSGTGYTRTLAFTPVAGAMGAADIIVSVLDGSNLVPAPFHATVARLVDATALPLAIPPAGMTGVTTSLVQVGTLGRIADLDVALDAAYPETADLRVRLFAPDGSVLTLVDGAGGAREDFTGTVFDDEAETPVIFGAAPFTGRFKPTTPLAAFTNKTTAGTWRLEVEDLGTNFTGTLLAWQLRFVTVPDAVAPVISLLGGSNVVVAWGSVFTDPGVTATDGVDGMLTAQVQVTGSVSTAVAGTQSLVYEVSDSSGNAAAPVTRVVQVVPPPAGEDLDTDGVPDVLEYALGGAIGPAHPALFPTVAMTSNTAAITLLARTNDPALAVTVWRTPDLAIPAAWTTNGVARVPAVDQSGVPAGFQRVVFTFDLAGVPQQFFRIGVAR